MDLDSREQRVGVQVAVEESNAKGPPHPLPLTSLPSMSAVVGTALVLLMILPVSSLLPGESPASRSQSGGIIWCGGGGEGGLPRSKHL